MAEPTASRAAPRVLCALGLVAVFALPACATTLISLGADAAYTASEERTTGEVVDDNKIKIELNELLADDSLGLWKDIGTVVTGAACC